MYPWYIVGQVITEHSTTMLCRALAVSAMQGIGGISGQLQQIQHCVSKILPMPCLHGTQFVEY